MGLLGRGSCRYRMATSGGGGYCDCGDLEAWKSEAYCDFHLRGSLRAAAGAEAAPPKVDLSPGE